MAKRSKTQKAKASASRQARKAEHDAELSVESAEGVNDVSDDKESEKASKLSLKKTSSEESKKPAKKSEDKPKKKHFQFLHDVKSELKRVTWPTKADVLRWSGVVVAALVFFGVFVAILDNLIITPILVAISGL
jgi:preprotein translocase subunit SecE